MIVPSLPVAADPAPVDDGRGFALLALAGRLVNTAGNSAVSIAGAALARRRWVVGWAGLGCHQGEGSSRLADGRPPGP